MPKTNFANGDPSQGIMGTVVTAEFLNAVNKHRHTGEDVDGAGVLDYAVDTGTANNYIIALNPALTAYVTGMPIYFKAANTNTGASTLNINALGAKAIKKNVDQYLVADDINAGQLITVIYDGTNFQMVSQVNLNDTLSIRDSSRNLIIKNNATNPNYKLDIAADEVILQNTAGKPFSVSAVNHTVDITAAGANGLDTGAEAISTWYHIWEIAKADGTKAALLSISATAPTMPSGYTYKAYIGAIYNDSSGNFIAIHQVGSRVARSEVAVLSSGTQTTTTSVSLASAVPTTAKLVRGSVQTEHSSGADHYVLLAATSSLELAQLYPGIRIFNYTSQTIIMFPFSQVIVEPQTIYYRVNVGVVNIYISSWEY
jgi:hypothetical protein